jgi:predicted dehydrogenase
LGTKIGICGLGSFGSRFLELYNAHPLVDEVVLADFIRERAEEQAEDRDKVSRIVDSLDALCDTDVDGVVLMTQRQLHGPQAVQALEAGKHVHCAVPIAQTIDEVRKIVETVETTRLIYMNGETSYYYPSAIYCRERYRKGDFGRFVYGEGQYLHDMDHFYQSFQRSGGAEWKRVAGIPPMHYPTHSTSFALSITGAHVTSVSCLGFVDDHEDGIFRRGANDWDNTFSNETALMRTSDGGMMRINEFRRIGWRTPRGGVFCRFYGTAASFESGGGGDTWITSDPDELTDLTDLLTCGKVAAPKEHRDEHGSVVDDLYSGVSKVHPIARLPREFLGLPNGHLGSHQFLVDDFVKAVVHNRLPPNHVWAAARYCIPGLVAHQSAECEGQPMDVPDLGDPPEGWELLETEEIPELVSR